MKNFLRGKFKKEEGGKGSGFDEEMTSPEVIKESAGFSRKKFILGLVIGVVVVVAVLLVIFAVMFYRFPTPYPVVTSMARFLHLPVASVDGRFISYDEIDKDFQTIKYYYAKEVELGYRTADQAVTDEQIKQDVMNQLINKAMVEKLAKQYGLSIADIEVESYWQKNVVAQSFNGNEADAIAKVKELYNMEPAEFKARVLKSNILYDKVASALEADTKLQEPAKARADEVLAKLQSGEKSFEDLAKEYSDDPTTKENGGELGWFSRGQMVTEFEDAAFALEVGKTSGLVKTVYGYHIIKLEEKKAASADGKTPEQVRAAHILIKSVTLQSYLDEANKSDRAKKYVQFAPEIPAVQ